MCIYLRTKFEVSRIILTSIYIYIYLHRIILTNIYIYIYLYTYIYLKKIPTLNVGLQIYE